MLAKVPGPGRRRPSRLLWVVAAVDGTGSFALPVVLLVAIPLLVWVNASPALIGIAVLAVATVLGGCGAVLAAAMAGTMLRGEDEHPQLARFLDSSRR